MNVDNEILINALKEEMTRSNNSSKWWSDHLVEQIDNLFGASLDASSKDAIMSSARVFIDSGSLATSQYFYTTKELSDKKEIFASATTYEKNNIFNQMSKEDKQSIINHNEHLNVNDIYELLTINDIELGNKKEIVNLLDDEKIRQLKENYSSLDEMLKTWLGERYNQIFGKEEIKEESKESKEIQGVENKTSDQENIMANYMNATNKVAFLTVLEICKKNKTYLVS